MSSDERETTRLRESLRPVRMQRVALTAGLEDFHEMLLRAGEAGCVELECPDPESQPAPESTAAHVVECYESAAVRRGGTAALTGWCPSADLDRLTASLEQVGGAVVALPAPRGSEPPTLLREGSTARRAFVPLVRTYGTVPYADLDPTLLAGITYVLMFGLMFGDAGHGVLLVICALILRSGRVARLARLRHLWPFVAGAGVAGTAAGLCYGEFFGPTGVVPAWWLKPLDQPLSLMAWTVGLGAVLLTAAYGIGTVNRWREGGAGVAMYAVSGAAGTVLFLGAGTLSVGLLGHARPVWIAGAALAALGLVAAGIGMAAVAPRGAARGFQVGIGLLDLVTRAGSNALSFARLAAFGLTHAALGLVIWQGTTGLMRHGPAAAVGAVLLFAVGNAAAFALEGLVVGVQAMRLEFYELFSRIFVEEGRPFRPFRLSARSPEAVP